MSEKSTRWTSDHLRKPGGTEVFGQQLRAELRVLADQVQALKREYQGDLETVRVDGDRPLEPKVRAWRAARPLAELERDLRHAMKAAKRLDAQYRRLYVELPEKRAEKERKKELEKQRRREIGNAPRRPSGAVTNIHQISQALAQNAPAVVEDAKPENDATFLDFLRGA